MSWLWDCVSPWLKRPELQKPIDHNYTKIYQSPPNRAPKIAPLAKLTPELLLSISDFLAPVDLACLCLCSRRFFGLLQRQTKRQPCPPDKISMLTRLERDLSGYFACDICCKFHHHDGTDCFGISGLYYERMCKLPCAHIVNRFGKTGLCMKSHRTPIYSEYTITFLHLKLVMKRFYHGPKFGIIPESLSYTQVRHFPENTVTPDITLLFSIDTQICSEPLGLHVRMQDILLFDHEKKSILLETNPLIDNVRTTHPADYLELCGHESYRGIMPCLESLFNLYPQERTYEVTCDRCNTDATIQLLKFGSKTAIVITRWLNLGPGLSKSDPLWLMHSETARGAAKTPEATNSAMPRFSFENTTRVSVQELRTHNLSYLFNQRYKTDMCRFEVGPDVWHQSYLGRKYLQEERHRRCCNSTINQVNQKLEEQRQRGDRLFTPRPFALWGD